MSELKSDEMAAAFTRRFNIEIETVWDMFSGNLVTERSDAADFTPEQKAWLDGWDDRGVA